ncbi:MAG: tyrosine-type recombinase/integrase [Nitrospirae bacterium]|nr:tyrosine-type recombinase/integrase [Nitrospirota bacterium]
MADDRAESPTLQETVDAFVAEVQARHARTGATYGYALNNWLRYLKDARIDPRKTPASGLTAGVVVRYPSWLASDHFKNRANPYTVGTYIAVVTAWLRYLQREQLAPDIASNMERIRHAYKDARPRGRRLPRTLRDDVIDKILKTIRTAHPGKSPRLQAARLRDIALVEALRSTGARISEILGADVEALDVRDKTLRVTGKGSKERIVMFDSTAWRALKAYLDARQALRLTVRGKSTPLFAQHGRRAGRILRRLSSHGARKMLWGYVKAAGIREKVTPHRLRHTYGFKILEATGDLAATQDLLGHASPTTTRIYAPLVSSRLRAAHKKAFPR